MAVLTHIIAADEDELEAVSASDDPASEWSGMAFRDFTIPRIAALHSVLTGDLLDDAYTLYEPSHLCEIEGAIVLQLSAELCDRLSNIDEAIVEIVADELAATEVFEETGLKADEINQMLHGLTGLARIAESQGQVLFASLHPLRSDGHHR